MPRFKLDIEYDGTAFQGWQYQPDFPTVQGEMARALQALRGEALMVQGAGRTDAGVHALGQVAHVELDWTLPPGRLRDALNAHLRPAPIAVTAVAIVDAGFDARYSATGRRYLYRILNRRAPPTVERDRVWHVMKPLDAEAMDRAARRLLGRHDFTTFRNADCQAKSPVKTLRLLTARRVGLEIHVEAEARSFLHNQVRSMVGCLKRVGEGAWAEEEITAVLEARDRARCAALAPPAGLYLAAVSYEAVPPLEAEEAGGDAGDGEA